MTKPVWFGSIDGFVQCWFATLDKKRNVEPSRLTLGLS
jgi:hypothetical protein